MNDQPSKRPARLAELSSWTTDWRECWGRRANELDEAGVPWPDHEVQAFDEVKALKAKGGKPPRPKLPAGRPPSKGKKTPAATTAALNLKPS